MTSTIYRQNYQAPTHFIETVDLDFDIAHEVSTVKSTLFVKPNPQHNSSTLVLNGENIELISVFIDGVELSESDYTVTEKTLTLQHIDRALTITITNRFSPKENTRLSGIYASGDNIMSQCESEGFRHITYFLDRPDVLSCYRVNITADKTRYPVLLSNGNLLKSEDLEGNRHTTRWEDPFLKPCYLFALVAGQLVSRDEKFILKNGKEVLLQVWVEPVNLDKTLHTMDSLKRAIRWDEERWGLELDLDRFMIVATNDFNFGAMENKGLNIFNAKYVLASPKMATDADYQNIESVVGHEYFHNWTGDRVTVRDWFQLTLKEGLTVFRDQEFSMDQLGDDSARAVQRINDVSHLRQAQFAEDAGPMAHPIRPDSYQEINNFYTMTVYEKGAEVIRMLQTLLGKETFRKGIDTYIANNDGKAVRCEDFLLAMEQASKRNLAQFARWYAQAGTPHIAAKDFWDPQTQTYTLTLSQETPPTPGQKKKDALHIPVLIGLLNDQGKDIDLVLENDLSNTGPHTRLLELFEKEQTWVFKNVTSQPVLSLGRSFSAPVIFEYEYTRTELAFLATYDSDPFNRYEAFKRLTYSIIQEQMLSTVKNTPVTIDSIFLKTFKHLLEDNGISEAFKASTLALPSVNEVAQKQTVIDPALIAHILNGLKATIGKTLRSTLEKTVQQNQILEAYCPCSEQAGKRALKSLCLKYLLTAGVTHTVIELRDMINTATNHTDYLNALTTLVHSPASIKDTLLEDAEKEWSNEPLLMNKWFTIQATAPSFNDASTLSNVRQLLSHPNFSIKNPNNVYALLLNFFNNNPAEFHLPDGTGYQFWAEMVITLDKINPSVAARIARALDHWRRYTPALSCIMYNALEYLEKEPLSTGVHEVIEKALKASN